MIGERWGEAWFRWAKKIVAGEMLSEAEKQEISGQIEQWYKMRLEIESLAARGLALAPPSFTEPILSGMRKAEETMQSVLQKLSDR